MVLYQNTTEQCLNQLYWLFLSKLRKSFCYANGFNTNWLWWSEMKFPIKKVHCKATIHQINHYWQHMSMHVCDLWHWTWLVKSSHCAFWLATQTAYCIVWMQGTDRTVPWKLQFSFRILDEILAFIVLGLLVLYLDYWSTSARVWNKKKPLYLTLKLQIVLNAHVVIVDYFIVVD